MSIPVKSTAPQPLQEALEEHYQLLVAESKKLPLPTIPLHPSTSSTPSSSASKATPPPPYLSPRSTASTASSDVSPSHSPPSSPFHFHRLKREQPLASLDDDDTDEPLTSPTPSTSPTLSSASSSSSSFHLSSQLAPSSHPSRLPPPPLTARVDSLIHLCTVALSFQLDHLSSLRHLPEEVVQSLLYLTIMRSALTPSLCALFAESRHDSVVEWIEDNIDTSAVFVPTTQSCRERF